MARKYRRDDVIKKSIMVNGDVIDFSEFEYVNSQTKSTFICKKCGNKFHATPNSLLNGHTCRKCFEKRLSEEKTQDIETVNKRILDAGVNVRIIGDYTNTKHKALAECLTCGNKWVANVRDLLNGHGCPECAKKKRFKSVGEFVEYCSNKYPEYDFSEVRNIPSEKYIEIKCKKHGKILVSRHRLIYGKSNILCEKCAEEIKFEKEAHNKKLREEREAAKRKKKEESENAKKLKQQIKSEKYIETHKNLPEIHGSEDFRNYLKVIFNNYNYDFSNTEFNGWDEETSYTCLEHNKTVTGKAFEIFNGKLCPKCAWHKMAFTTDEWVKQAKEVHPEIDYSETTYTNKNTKVKLICKKHGQFYVMPRKFITGESYCPECRNEEKRDKVFENTKKKFLDRMNKLYKGMDYDLSNVEFKGMLERVEIKCNKHNLIFRPLPFNILYTNSRCPECIKEGIESPNRETLQDIREYLEEHFRGVVELCDDNEEPKNVDTKLKLICHEKYEDGTEHGVFYKSSHLIKKGKVCPVCGRISAGLKNRTSQEEYMNKVSDVHLGRDYDLSKIVYNGLDKPIRVICNKKDKNGHIHGEFSITAHSFLSGCGCPKCNSSHMEQDIRHELIIHGYDYEEQKRFDWLGRQSIDFYIPSLNIGIECQGYQHFNKEYYILHNPEDAEERYQKRLELDARKKMLCKENNVRLIYYVARQNLKFMADDDIVISRKEDLDDLLKPIQET